MGNRNLVMEGTSISVGGSYLALYQPVAAVATDLLSLAVNGSTISDIVGRAAACDAQLRVGDVNILHVEFGANDFSGGDTVANAAALASMASYLSARRAAGWFVVAATLLPQSSSHTNFVAYRATGVAEIRTWIGARCHALSDWAADAVMGTDAAGNNTALYGDGLHPTSTGQQNMANICAPVLETFISLTRRRFSIR